MNVHVPTPTKKRKSLRRKSVVHEFTAIAGILSVYKQYFPNLDTDYVHKYFNMYFKNTCLGWADTLCVLPKPGRLGNTYTEELVCTMHVFRNTYGAHVINQLTIEDVYVIEQYQKSIRGMHILCEQQPNGDVVLVPALLDAVYHEKSMQWVHANMSLYEFGFGLKDALTVLMTMPTRLEQKVMVNCIGDICSVAGIPDHSPVIYWVYYNNTFVVSQVPRFEADNNFAPMTGHANKNTAL